MDWCSTNDCENPDCHRCFPRQGCELHEKCEEFTESGEAYTEEESEELGWRLEKSERLPCLWVNSADDSDVELTDVALGKLRQAIFTKQADKQGLNWDEDKDKDGYSQIHIYGTVKQIETLVRELKVATLSVGNMLTHAYDLIAKSTDADRNLFGNTLDVFTEEDQTEALKWAGDFSIDVELEGQF